MLKRFQWLIAIGAAAVLLCLSGVGSLFAESKLPAFAESKTGAGGAVARLGIGNSSMIELRSAGQTWQGVAVGRGQNQMLMLTRDGQLRRLGLDSGYQIQDLGRTFESATHRELEAGLRKEFGPRFKVFRTPHYVVCHNTSDAFAQETGELVEQLCKAFTAYFGGRGMGLDRPQFPMVLLVFNSEAEFHEYRNKSKESSSLTQIAGYYSISTNRVAFFNAAGKDSAKYGNAQWHNMSTVIHEATHQIAFNSGCHPRLAENPRWIIEGLATYFETPELQGKKIAWSEVGKVNGPRLDRFVAYRKKGRKPDSIKRLIATDDRFRGDDIAGDAYSESWAMTHFLVNKRMPQFLKYLKLLGAKQPFESDTPEQRLEDFQTAFGRNMQLLDNSFLSYVDDLAKK